MHGPGVVWGDREELLATTVEQLQQIICLLHAAWFKEPHPEPIRVPRPGEGGHVAEPAEMVEPPKMSTAAEIRAFFGGEGTKAVFSRS